MLTVTLQKTIHRNTSSARLLFVTVFRLKWQKCSLAKNLAAKMCLCDHCELGLFNLFYHRKHSYHVSLCFCHSYVSCSLYKQKSVSPHVDLRHFHRTAQCFGTSHFALIKFQARMKRASTLLSVEWKTLISLWVIVDRGQCHCTSDLFTQLNSRPCIPDNTQ